jgi:hypothetical protein
MTMLPYDAKNKKADALVKAGLMEAPRKEGGPHKEGGPQPVAPAPSQQRQERTQAP